MATPESNPTLPPTAPAPTRWSEWTALVAIVPELATLLDSIRESHRFRRTLAHAWFGENIPGKIRMILARAQRQGAALPADAALIATDRLIGELLTNPRRSRRSAEILQ